MIFDVWSSTFCKPIDPSLHWTDFKFFTLVTQFLLFADYPCTVTWTNHYQDLAEELLRIGCSPFYADSNGDSVLHYAVRGGNLTFLVYLYNRLGDSILSVLVKLQT